MSLDPTVTALTRIADALEQLTLELLDGKRGASMTVSAPVEVRADPATTSVDTGPIPVRTAASPVPLPERTDPPAQTFAPIGWKCPQHGTQKIVPGGVSKKTGRPYDAFVACGTPGCNETAKAGWRPATTR